MSARNTDDPRDPTRANTLTDLAKVIIQATKLGIRVATPGIIFAYSPLTQLATVDTMILGIDVIANVDVPQKPIRIPNVPVGWPGTLTSYQTFPLAKGDTGQLILNDRSIESWLDLGVTAPPPIEHTHNLIDAVFYPTMRPKLRQLPSTDPAAHVIEGAQVKIGRGAVSPMARSIQLLTALDSAITAAVSAAAAIVPPAGDGGSAGFVAFQTAWNLAKADIAALKGRVE